MKVDNQLYFAVVEERLNAGERVKITLVGTSMQPTLCPGDTLTLEPLTGDPAVGDVVLFRHHGHHLLHRIVAITDGQYTTRGDNCAAPEHCRRSDIVARMVAVKRRNPMKNISLRWLGHRGRRQLRPWYFLLLAILMWAPLNGLGLPLDNYILGLRADHLLHASLYIPCALFLMDPLHRRWWLVWLCAVAIGLLTEGGQYLLPYRGYDVNDLIANTLGATLGWLVLRLARHSHP